MSITISTCNQICNSPHNHSKSKMLYSFNKTPRFPNHSSLICDQFYDIQTQHNSRATNFGYGKKFDFTSIAPKTPSPHTYHINNQFDECLKHKKGYGFGEGRNEMKVTGPYANIYQNKNPGPASYNTPTGRCMTAYSIKKKINYDNTTQKNNPGPDQIPQYLSKDGKNYISNYKNIVTSLFTNKSQRFKSIESQTPGPGMYVKSKIDTSPEGKYNISNIPNTPCYRFKTANRKNNSKTFITPGPASYLAPSEFGYYISRKAKNLHKQQSQSINLKKVKANKENIILNN